MRPMRGYTLFLMMGILAALAAAGSVVSLRLQAGHGQALRSREREILLWVARSAALASVPGDRTVPTPAGDVAVTVRREGAWVVAEARRGRAVARVERPSRGQGAWIERHDPGGGS